MATPNQSAVSQQPSDAPSTVDVYRLFLARWRAGERPNFRSAVMAIAPADRAPMMPQFLRADIYYRQRKGEHPTAADYLSDFPDCARAIASVFGAFEESVSHSFLSTVTLARNPAAAGSLPAEEYALDLPMSVGRYRLESPLGSGGFASVWRAFDPALQRNVAVKLPRLDHAWSSEVAHQMLAEARRISGLNLSGVVPVYDLVEEEGQSYIVSKLMEGGTLSARMKNRAYSFGEACRLVAAIADTLHQAHLKNVVHRDIKPSNVLLEENGTPWVADFGLATNEVEQRADSGIVLGSYHYMSPEQARGDGHLVDARTDIYSLGMVFYELLTGRVAFLGQAADDLIEQILKRQPRPPRTINDAIPTELERICLKCLAKDITQRYVTAGDLAADLRNWVGGQESAPTTASQVDARKLRPLTLAFAGLLALACLLAIANGALRWSGALDDTTLGGKGEAAALPSQDRVAADGQAKPSLITEEAIWRQRLGGDIKDLIFPGYKGRGVLKFDDSLRVLTITSQERRFISLGRLEGQPVTISLNLCQPTWSDECGIFLGYREEIVDGLLLPQFQGILIRPVYIPEKGTQLQLRRCWFSLSSDRRYITPRKEIGEQIVPWPVRDNLPRFELRFSERGLEFGRWGATDFDTVIEHSIGSVLPMTETVGDWGIYHEQGTTWCQDPQVK